MEFEDDENVIEKENIVEEFLSGNSIRKISENHPGYTRRRINNIINEYASRSKENAAEIERKKLMNKTHKTSEEVQAYSDAEIDEETIESLYRKIMNNQITLTEAASIVGRTRDYLKSRIIEYINDAEEIKEFKRVLKSNQNSNRQDKYSEYMKLSLDERKEVIFKRLQQRVECSKRTMYKVDVLELKFQRLKKYLLEKRNSKIPEEVRLTENQFYTMLFDTPGLLNMSLGNKIRPALENLDNNLDIGYKRANDIISHDASILGSSIMRTNLQIKMLVDFGYLELFLQKPRNFRNSPEMLYALIMFHNNKDINSPEIFWSRNKLRIRYGVTPEELKEQYDVRKDYGDDEYFDSSR